MSVCVMFIFLLLIFTKGSHRHIHFSDTLKLISLISMECMLNFVFKHVLCNFYYLGGRMGGFGKLVNLKRIVNSKYVMSINAVCFYLYKINKLTYEFLFILSYPIYCCTYIVYILIIIDILHTELIHLAFIGEDSCSLLLYFFIYYYNIACMTITQDITLFKIHFKN